MGATYKELFKLYDLIQNGDTSAVEKFLNNNSADINEILPCKGIGILHLAVGIDPLDKSIECTELILKHGGNPNLSTEDGVTPVHIAAIWGRVENLKLLIGCGGDPSIHDWDGYSAFDYAAREQQWNVYDYLHNIIDPAENSFGSQCAYTLDFDRLLVTTDELIAEYKPSNDGYQVHDATCRKSEMVQEWCEKTSLVMNKLYPTILSETYLIENESAPWRTIDITENATFNLDKDRTSNETQLSFKTYFSKRSECGEISGLKPIELPVAESKHSSCSCDNTTDLQKRMSVYENFSLPGSPKCITHCNYKTRSNVRKCKNQNVKSSLSNEFQEKLSLEIQTIDESKTDFNKDLAILQNTTNEMLSNHICQRDLIGSNTRRSSASSGVSSNFSAGSIILANVHEEYRYEDKEEDVVLIEKRLLVSPVVLPVNDFAEPANQTVYSIASSLPATVEYDNNKLRAELIRLGFNPGPIINSTKSLYLKKLSELKKINRGIPQNIPGSIHPQPQQKKTYSVELEKSLRSDEWIKNLTPYIELEKKARLDFTQSNKEWREGKAKTSFTYLLLDPRLTRDLPAQARTQSQHSSWITFVNSIFYVGKGKRSRPYSHLYQALNLWKRKFTGSKDKKVQHILDIWSDNVGVICLHIFQNVIPAEAFTYEAAMIDVIGVQNLKNLKSGNYYGVTSSWPLKDRRTLGLYLLYKAMLIFLSEGERQLRPEDID